ncbi:MAG TPA: FHA domain-containing protein [Kiritimatiellia bacterium]|nr:FHA domain-containing protein [Kiritimatiellia bacterium]
MAVLIGMSGDLKGKSFTLDTLEVTVGRNEDNVISINNPAVSGRHCVIRHEDDRYVLKDLGSTNGTHVNNKQVPEAELKPKDLIQIGNVEFLFNSEHMSYSEAEQIYSKTEVIEAAGPAVKPDSFASISPFGARQKENQGMWTLLIAVIGVAALGVVVYLIFTLFQQ